MRTYHVCHKHIVTDSMGHYLLLTPEQAENENIRPNVPWRESDFVAADAYIGGLFHFLSREIYELEERVEVLNQSRDGDALSEKDFREIQLAVGIHNTISDFRTQAAAS